MAEKRSTARWSARLPVRFWRKADPSERFLGFTANISHSGMFITTSHPIGRNGRIEADIEGDRGSFQIDAVVARAEAVPFALRQVRTGGMGVRFLNVEELLAEVSRSVRSGHGVRSGRDPLETNLPSPDDSPASSSGHELQDVAVPGSLPRGLRHPPENPPGPGPSRIPGTSVPLLTYPVQFRSDEQFQQLYDRDMRTGRLFVSTPQPAAIDQTVRLLLRLPRDSASIEIHAVVVQVVPAERAGNTNLLSGMGVRFLEPELARDRLESYLRGCL